MIKFRPHRGSLAEAMKEEKAFFTVQEMKNYIAENCNHMICEEDIVIKEEVFFDERINWNTQYVCVKKIGNEEYNTPQCIGMCEIKEEEKRFDKRNLKDGYYLATRNGQIYAFSKDTIKDWITEGSYPREYCIPRFTAFGLSGVLDLELYRYDLRYNSTSIYDRYLDIVEVFCLSKEKNKRTTINTIWIEGDNKSFICSLEL